MLTAVMVVIVLQVQQQVITQGVLVAQLELRETKQLT